MGIGHAPSILSNHLGRVLHPGFADTTLLEKIPKLVGETRHVAATVSKARQERRFPKRNGSNASALSMSFAPFPTAKQS